MNLYVQRRSLIRPCNIEYIDFNCNYYHGCSHNCQYPCYAKGIARETEEQWITVRVVENAMALIEREAWGINFDGKEVMLCSMTDPYQPLETRVGLTRKVVKCLIGAEVPFAILTKGAAVVRDLRLLADYPHARVGFSLVFANEAHRKKWEPGASSLNDRVGALKIAHDLGIKTWVSCEPIILGASHLDEIVSPLVDYVDRWVFGRLSKRTSPRAFDGHYARIRTQIEELCKAQGLTYLIKAELQEAGTHAEMDISQTQLPHPS